MTEDEAKTKWCPFARAPMGPFDEGNTAVNRTYSGNRPDEGCLCIASACMAWRWAGYRAKDGTWVQKVADGAWTPAKADGYCGLAGPIQ